jgi:hypothetical protein
MANTHKFLLIRTISDSAGQFFYKGRLTRLELLRNGLVEWALLGHAMLDLKFIF